MALQRPKKRSKSRSRKKRKGSKKPGSFLRALRGTLGLTFFVTLALLFASLYVRFRVIEAVGDRTLASSSVVLSRPFPVTAEISFVKSRILSRLKRLGYKQVSEIPTMAGQFSLLGNDAYLYLRETRLPSGETQTERLILLALNQQRIIKEIVDVKFQRPLSTAWLEPEVLSTLGTTSTRATTPKRLQDFSPFLLKAILAIEDERFHQHPGIDIKAILRALYVNAQAGRVVQGGSTITQQLAKNLFFTRERTLSRKFYEAFAALLMETAFTKEQILEYYLNEVFLGQEGRVAIHGFGEASLSYFGKSISDITLAEATILAGMVKAPSRYNPRRHPSDAKTRRDVVLKRLLDLGKITLAESKKARDEPLRTRRARRATRIAPYFIDSLRKVASVTLDTYEIRPDKIKIHTGIDREYQICAEKALDNGLKSLERKYRKIRSHSSPPQGALLAVSPVSGDVLAWIGGRNYKKSQFDRVTMAKRQPGSAFKPFAYLTALDQTLNNYRVARTTSLLEDRPLSLADNNGKIWEPKNYDDTFRGEVTVREALAFSLNVPTVNLALKVGPERIAHTAELLGLGRNLMAVPSLALGAVEVSPLELTQAYMTIANGGILSNLRLFRAVTEDEKDLPVLTAIHLEKRVASESAVFVLTNILQSVIEDGTGHVVRRLGFNAPVAGKTGTSNDERDAWFVGFTPRILATIWIGFDDNSSLGLTGGQAAAPIWTEFMKCASVMEPELSFIPPPGVIYQDVDIQTGLLATSKCPSRDIVTEVFVQGSAPVTPCPLHSTQTTKNHRKPQSSVTHSLQKLLKNLWTP